MEEWKKYEPELTSRTKLCIDWLNVTICIFKINLTINLDLNKCSYVSLVF